MDAAAGMTGHVVAVDDDPSMRQMIADYLSDNALRVTAVASGKELDAVLEVYDRAIDVQVGRLRRKLMDGPDSASPVKTERGVGYVFALPAEPVY